MFHTEATVRQIHASPIPCLRQALDLAAHWFGAALIATMPRRSLERTHRHWSTQMFAILDAPATDGPDAVASVRSLAQAKSAKLDEGMRMSQMAFDQRLASLSEPLGLQPLDRRFLLFACAFDYCRDLAELCDAVTVKTAEQAAHLLSPLLGADNSDCVRLLTGKGAMFASGLANLESRAFRDLTSLPRINSAFLEGVFEDEPLHEAMLRSCFVAAPPARRRLADFAYLADELVLMQALVATTRQGKPSQILLAGPPGVGKTELARLLAQSVGCSVFEVRGDDEEGGGATRRERFTHYRLGCRLLGARPDTLVIFDEAEDVFTGDHWAHVQQSPERHKAWTNRLLETATLPTVWISNSLSRIDPAYLRRFDYVADLQVPPRSVRLHLAQEATRDSAVSPILLESLAESGDFTPADADRLARLLPIAIGAGLTPDVALRQLAACRPDGISRAQLAPKRGGALPYKLEWINVPADLRQLIAGLRRRGAGTFIFSGPPGTGKTELARHIAKALDRPLHAKKASEILSPWIGTTEANIASAFDNALRDGAVLLLDEADSFLRDRALAQRSWEVTEVNELLAQLDGYSGIAILTTNFTDLLDRAVMRRADLKLAFEYLRPQHAWDAFVALLEVFGCPVPSADSAVATEMRELRELAMGDFAAAQRGLGFAAESISAEMLLEALAAEVRLRQGGRRPIGFARSRG